MLTCNDKHCMFSAEARIRMNRSLEKQTIFYRIESETIISTNFASELFDDIANS